MAIKGMNLETLETPGRKFRPGDLVWAQCSRTEVNLVGRLPGRVVRDATATDILHSFYPASIPQYMVEIEGRSSKEVSEILDGYWCATEENLEPREPEVVPQLAFDKKAVEPAKLEHRIADVLTSYQPAAQLEYLPEKEGA